MSENHGIQFAGNRDQQSRFEKSLGLLTTRFVSLLQKAQDGVLDLKMVMYIHRGSVRSDCYLFVF